MVPKVAPSDAVPRPSNDDTLQESEREECKPDDGNVASVLGAGRTPSVDGSAREFFSDGDMTLLKAFRFVCKLVAYSVLGLLPVAWYNGLDYLRLSLGISTEPDVQLFNFDVRGEEAFPSIHPATTNVGIMKFILGVLPASAICLIAFYPLNFYFYLGRAFPWRHMLACCTGALAFLFGSSLSVFFSFGLVSYPLVAMLLCVLALKYGLPKDSRVHRCMVYQIGITLLMTVCLLVFGSVSISKNTIPYNMLNLLVVLPIMKELSRFAALCTVWYLSCDGEIAGKGVRPNRANAWGIFFWVQAVFAIYLRFQFTSIDDPATALFFILLQGGLEIFLRITMKQRDGVIRRNFQSMKQKASSARRIGRQATKVADLFLSSEFTLKEISREEAEHNFYSLAVMTDMIAEYVAIMLTCASIWAWSAKPLYRSFPAYAGIEGIFSGKPKFGSLYISTAVQICVEIVVDTVCVVYESRKRKFKFVRAWHVHSQGVFFVIFVFSVWIAVTNATALILYSSLTAVSTCATSFPADACYCYQNLNSLMQAFCESRYPLTNGFPYNASNLP